MQCSFATAATTTATAPTADPTTATTRRWLCIVSSATPTADSAADTTDSAADPTDTTANPANSTANPITGSEPVADPKNCQKNTIWTGDSRYFEIQPGQYY